MPRPKNEEAGRRISIRITVSEYEAMRHRAFDERRSIANLARKYVLKSLDTDLKVSPASAAR